MSLLKQNAIKELQNTGLFSFFEVVMGKEDCHDFKPSPVPLLQLAEKLTVKPIECLYIGDQPTDIQATHSANMVSVAALWGEGKMERLSPLNPSFLFNSPNQLTELLLKQKTVIEGLLYMNFSYSAKGGAALIRISAFFCAKVAEYLKKDFQ